jgi:hypothetical protein
MTAINRILFIGDLSKKFTGIIAQPTRRSQQAPYLKPPGGEANGDNDGFSTLI